MAATEETRVDGIPAEELRFLASCVREACGLAKSGRTDLGRLTLVEGRDSILSLAPHVSWGGELLSHWDQGVQWFDRHLAQRGVEPASLGH